MDLNAGNRFVRDEWDGACLLGTAIRCFSVADILVDGSHFYRLGKQTILSDFGRSRYRAKVKMKWNETYLACMKQYRNCTRLHFYVS